MMRWSKVFFFFMPAARQNRAGPQARQGEQTEGNRTPEESRQSARCRNQPQQYSWAPTNAHARSRTMVQCTTSPSHHVTHVPSSSQSSSSSSSAAPASTPAVAADAAPPALGDAENNRTSADRRGDPTARGELTLPGLPPPAPVEPPAPPAPADGRTAVGTTLWIMPDSGGVAGAAAAAGAPAGAPPADAAAAAGVAATAEPPTAAAPLAPGGNGASPPSAAAGRDAAEPATGESVSPSPPRTDVGVVRGTAERPFPGGCPAWAAGPVPVAGAVAAALPFKSAASSGGTNGVAVVPVIASAVGCVAASGDPPAPRPRRRDAASSRRLRRQPAGTDATAVAARHVVVHHPATVTTRSHSNDPSLPLHPPPPPPCVNPRRHKDTTTASQPLRCRHAVTRARAPTKEQEHRANKKNTNQWRLRPRWRAGPGRDTPQVRAAGATNAATGVKGGGVEGHPVAQRSGAGGGR